MTEAEHEAVLALVAESGHGARFAQKGPDIAATCICGRWDTTTTPTEAFTAWRDHLEEQWELRVMTAEQWVIPEDAATP